VPHGQVTLPLHAIRDLSSPLQGLGKAALSSALALSAGHKIISQHSSLVIQ
jgi:hypothetical protein